MDRGAVARGAMRCVRPRPPLSAGRMTLVNDEDIVWFVSLSSRIEEQTVSGKYDCRRKEKVTRLEQGVRRVSKRRRSQAKRSTNTANLMR